MYTEEQGIVSLLSSAGLLGSVQLARISPKCGVLLSVCGSFEGCDMNIGTSQPEEVTIDCSADLSSSLLLENKRDILLDMLIRL